MGRMADDGAGSSVPLILVGIGLLVYAWKTKHPQEGPRYGIE